MNINRENEKRILEERQKQKEKENLNKKIIKYITPIFLIGISIYGCNYINNFNIVKKYEDKILPNTYIDGIDISNKTYKELSTIITKQQNILNNTKIILKIGENEYSKTLLDLGVIYKPTLADEIFYNNKNLSVNKQANIIKGKLGDTKFATVFKYEDDKLKEFLNYIYSMEKVNEINPTIQISNNKVNILDGSVGKEIDKIELYNTIQEELNKLNVGNNIELNRETNIIEFKDTKSELLKINRKVASYSTQINSSSPMYNNIKLATSKLNGVILMSGETFSFLDTIGPLTIENGYEEAKGYNSDILEFGAGVCQVASTLYNSNILIGLTPKTFENHSIPLPYVPIGQDVSIHDNDYKFTNTTSYPIYINAYITNNKLTVDLWSNHNIINGKTYQLKKEISADGLTIRTFLEMYNGDKKINVKNINTCTYERLR